MQTLATSNVPAADLRRKERTVVERNLQPPAGFLLPAVVMFSVFTIFPCVIGILTSFTNWNGLTFDLEKIKFVGINNFIRIFSDKAVLSRIGYTVSLALVLTVIENILGLVFAVMLRRTGPLSGIVRCAIYIPGIISAIAMGFLWKGMLNYVGVINSVLKLLGLNAFLIHAFDTAFSSTVSICIVHIWSAVGYYMILYLSALQGISQDLYEAAALDGANAWNKMLRITVPLIVPQIIICLMLSVLNNMGIYELVVAITGGGPGKSTQTLMWAILTEGLEKWRVGYASALSLTYGIVIFLINRISRMFARKMGVEQ